MQICVFILVLISDYYHDKVLKVKFLAQEICTFFKVYKKDCLYDHTNFNSRQ